MAPSRNSRARSARPIAGGAWDTNVPSPRRTSRTPASVNRGLAGLLSFCSPYLQDLVIFAINTGLRLGEILNLTWKEVDLESGILTLLVRKSRRMLELPLNKKALSILNGWQ